MTSLQIPEHGSTALADVIIVAADTLAACRVVIVCIVVVDSPWVSVVVIVRIVVVDAPTASDCGIRALDEPLKVALGLLD